MNNTKTQTQGSKGPWPCESFEESHVPEHWKIAAEGGNLQLSTRHYKDGNQSLQWTWANGAPLSCAGLAISTEHHPQAGMKGWVYCEKAVADKLTFRLGSQAAFAVGKPAFVFRFNLDFTGWRAFQVQFDKDARLPGDGGAPAEEIEVLEIVPPASVPVGCVYLDAVEIARSMNWNRSADYQIPEHAGDLGEYWQHWPLHYMRQKPVESLPLTVTAGQRQAFEIIYGRCRKWLFGDCPDLRKPVLAAGAKQTQVYIQRGWDDFLALDLKVDGNGWITGPGLTMGRGPTSFHHVFYDVLLPLVFDYKINGKAAAKDAVLLLFDYLHDQGWAEGSANGSLILNCLVFAPYCHAVALMRDELHESGRLEAAVRAALWYLSFGKSFSNFSAGFIETNADELRSTVFTSLVMVLAMKDSPLKVQYMHGWLAWFNNALEISPRFAGVFKPDGTGFHHQAIYASAYTTETYEFSALIVYLLHGTEFAAAPVGVANLCNALKTQAIISHKYEVPYATQGRMPGLGVRVFSAYAYMALAGEADDQETHQPATADQRRLQGSSPDVTAPDKAWPHKEHAGTVDSDLAGIFMRLWDPESVYLKDVLSVDLDGAGGKFICNQTPGRLQIMQELADRNLPAAPSPQGFWSQPWGALGIHRRENWLVSVKGWSQYVWDFESHPKCWAAVEENVFARYWSYGTLQPITHGKPANPVDSGWNLDKGWDWCRWPGATTPHLTLHGLYDPKTTWASRFFSSATFVGGVSCEGRNGMFALKLHEHYYDPTFRAYKTYFFFDNEIICLGSNIESRDAAHAFGTTLFQSWMLEQGRPLQVNGETVTAFPYEFRGVAGQPLTLLDPYGNGYFVPDSRDLRLIRGEQKSRDAWNRGETSGAFSTCWLDHGTPPKDDGYGSERYHYAMLVQTSPEALAAYAKAAPYRVLQQNHQAHILEHLGQKTMAYALFETDWIIPHGIVRKTDIPVMVMVKEQGDGVVVLSLADPDLRLPKRRNLGYIDPEAAVTPSRPSVVHVELRGQWELKTPATGTRVAGMFGESTVIEIDCCNGIGTEMSLNSSAGRCGWQGEARIG